MPLYLVVAAGALAYARCARLRDAATRRSAAPGALEWALAAVLVLYARAGDATRATSTARWRTSSSSTCRSRVLFALLARVRVDAAAGRADASACSSCLAIALVGVGFCRVRDARTCCSTRKVINSNQFEYYFRVNSLFFDPNIYGRFLVVVMLGVAAVVAVDARRTRDGARRRGRCSRCCGRASC